MGRKPSLLVIVMAVLVLGLLCLHAPAQSDDNTDVTALVDGNTVFALNLYKHLSTADNNLFFSPYSISAALAMTYAGARGNTSRQMSEVLGFCLDQKQLHTTFGRLERDLNALQKEGGIQLSVANALWAQKDHPFLEEFFDLVTTNYHAALNYADFKTDFESARQAINAWVEQQTNQKIKDLIGRGVLHDLTRLVLTNAIYFKGFWANQFDKDATKDDKFWTRGDISVDVPMMTQQDRFRYTEDADMQAIELPYVGNDLSMVILLPRERNGLVSMERALTVQYMRASLSRLEDREVIVCLPRFTLSSSFGLEETLASMGMPDAFGPDTADFSGMDGKKVLYISAVVHKAFVDVNEEGTEAAAATGVVMTLTSAPSAPALFRADHPFIFLIRDIRSESILFLGRVINPLK